METELQRAHAQLSGGPHTSLLDQAAALIPSLRLEAAIERTFQDRDWAVLETEMQELQPQLSDGPYAHTLDQAAALIEEIKVFEAEVCSIVRTRVKSKHVTCCHSCKHIRPSAVMHAGKGQGGG